MGQQCSVLTCQHVEDPSLAGMSRVDSPDPFMYDLMRRSILATEMLELSQSSEGGPSSRKRRPVGQSHLLYKNTSKQISGCSMGSPAHATDNHSVQVPVAVPLVRVTNNSNPRGAESGSHNQKHHPGSKSSSPPPSWPLPSSDEDITFLGEAVTTSTRCPTRLLIRQRPVQVLEEGGGTHIYAIRYPDDTPQTVVSEQAAPVAAPVRLEQCPPRKPTIQTSTTASSPSSTAVLPNKTAPARFLNAATKAKPCQSVSKSSSKLQQQQTSNTVTGTAPAGSSSHQQNFTSTRKAPTSTPPAACPVTPSAVSMGTAETVAVVDVFSGSAMAAPPKIPVVEWVTISEEHHIYVADVGMTAAQCDHLVNATEQACRGTYAAYTYAKQTLGCREYPSLTEASLDPVHSIVHGITSRFGSDSPPRLPSEKCINNTGGTNANTKPSGSSNSKDQQLNVDTNIKATVSVDPSTDVNHQRSASSASPTSANNSTNIIQQIHLQLDDREPHIVKYDVTKKERQKLDMHTDKSEWTFLIALSNGCGVDYEGGGTYFECIDATVHVQRGHALAFPGKLRHCGQKITSGLRFLLVGFLVDKSSLSSTGTANNNQANTSVAGKTTGGSTPTTDASADGSAGVAISPIAASGTTTADIKAKVPASFSKG